MSLATQRLHEPRRPRGSRRSAPWGLALLVAVGAFIGRGEAAFGQLIVAPAAQSVTHNGTDGPQAFPEVAWQLHSGLDPLGYTVQWSSSPFQHTSRESLKADCKLQIRILASAGSANWTIASPSDQTDYAGGDQSAVVAAQSVAEGDGEVGLTVTFLDGDFSKLGAGSYMLTVTGTITSN